MVWRRAAAARGEGRRDAATNTGWERIWLAGEHPQALVPAGAWQIARSLGAWTLLGCTVAPGFDFAGLELAPEGWEP